MRRKRPEAAGRVNFEKELREILAAFKAHAEEEVRRMYREEQGLIYVRRHVVEAYFRPAKRRRRRARPELVALAGGRR